MARRVASRGLRVLLVEDDEGVRRSLQLLLEWNGFEVRAHARASSAVGLDTLAAIDLLVADYLLEDGDAINLLGDLRAAGWEGRAILITGEGTEGVERHAIAAGFSAVLEKPIVRDELIRALTCS